MILIKNNTRTKSKGRNRIRFDKGEQIGSWYHRDESKGACKLALEGKQLLEGLVRGHD